MEVRRLPDLVLSSYKLERSWEKAIQIDVEAANESGGNTHWEFETDNAGAAVTAAHELTHADEAATDLPKYVKDAKDGTAELPTSAPRTNERKVAKEIIEEEREDND